MGSCREGVDSNVDTGIGGRVVVISAHDDNSKKMSCYLKFDMTNLVIELCPDRVKMT